MIRSVLKWVWANKEWLFSGVFVAAVSSSLNFWMKKRKRVEAAGIKTVTPTVLSASQDAALNLAAGASVSAPFLVGSNNTQYINLLPSSPAAKDLETTDDSVEELLRSMPALTGEMRTDLLNPDNEFVREFFVLPHSRVTLGGSSKPRFTFYEDEHPKLRNQLDLLEENGLVKNATPLGNNIPIYRMTDRLVTWLRASMPISAPTLELPSLRPIIVPRRYGNGLTKQQGGYTGLAVGNDGELPAYQISPVSPLKFEKAGVIELQGHTDRLTKTDGEAFYPVFINPEHGTGTFGGYLYSFMVENQFDRIEIPVTYRDAEQRWYQTDIVLIKDQMARSTEISIGGIRHDWKQRRIPPPPNLSDFQTPR